MSAATHGHSEGDHFDAEHVVGALQTEGELASGLTGEAIEVCAGQLAGAEVAVERVVDLGCGPGIATVQLAERFPRAAILAVDGSARMLAEARARVERHRIADRVHTRQLDLDGDLRALGPCELAYAAMAIHHAKDEVATLTNIRKVLAPHGFLCLLERAEPTDVRLAGELDRPGIWDRLRAGGLNALERARPALPGAMNAERYPEMLAAAGLHVVVSRTLSDTVTVRNDSAQREFVAAHLHAAVKNLRADAGAADLDAVRAVLTTAPQSDPRWDAATVTLSRRLYVTRSAVEDAPRS